MSRWLIVCSMAASAIFLATVGPIPQDPAYHDFADARQLFNVANFWNVLSNLPFLVVGGAGLLVVTTNPEVLRSNHMQAPWVTFFSGLALTAFGSGYFHLAPSNASLLWDRAAMTIGFAGFVTVVIGEYFSPRAASRLLGPFAVLGVLSVLYWGATESAGHGDLRPYVIVQFLPVLFVPAILVLRRHASDLTAPFWVMIGAYLLAKVLEHFDERIYVMTGAVSGHSLKHVVAALAPVVLIRALLARREEQINEPQRL